MILITTHKKMQLDDDKTNNRIKTFIAAGLMLALVIGYWYNATNAPSDPDAPLEFLCGAVGVMVGYYWREKK